MKTQKCSISDPESGWFRKDEHKHVFAYAVETACDKHECQCLSKCTESKDHVKLIARHVWEEYMEVVEDIRHTIGNRQIYQLRKETIERIFGTAKEQHGFRYTQYVGKARMEMKAGLTFACMNLKKLAAYSQTALAKSEELAKQAKFVELATSRQFQETYLKRLNF